MADSVDLVHAVSSSEGKRALVADACGVGGEAARRLFWALAAHHGSTLSALSLRQNLIGECHAPDLSHFLHEATALQELALSGNALGDGALEALAQPLAGHPRLHTLHIADNPFSARGGAVLVQALQARKGPAALRCLDLAATSVDASVARRLAEYIRDRLTVLSELDLSFTAIGGAGVRAVAAALADAPRANQAFVLHIRGLELSPRTQSELERARSAWGACGGRLDLGDSAA